MFQNQLSKIRYSILESCYRIREGHIGSAFSVLEILFVIFRKYFKKNYFILSKGHAAIGVYAIMNHFKILKGKDYRSFCNFNSKLGGHPDSTKLPNFNFSTAFSLASLVEIGLVRCKSRKAIFSQIVKLSNKAPP